MRYVVLLLLIFTQNVIAQEFAKSFNYKPDLKTFKPEEFLKVLQQSELAFAECVSIVDEIVKADPPANTGMYMQFLTISKNRADALAELLSPNYLASKFGTTKLSGKDEAIRIKLAEVSSRTRAFTNELHKALGKPDYYFPTDEQQQKVGDRKTITAITVQWRKDLLAANEMEMKTCSTERKNHLQEVNKILSDK